MIGNARMYAQDATTADAWRSVLEWVSHRSGAAFDVVDYPAPQPLAARGRDPDLACAFMCGYPFGAAPRPARSRHRCPARHNTEASRLLDGPRHFGSRANRRSAMHSASASPGLARIRNPAGTRPLLLASYAQRHGVPLFAETLGRW
jgi:hypothetical protein